MENNTLCNRHSLGVNNHTKMYVTYTRIYGWSDYGGESSYQPGYRLENMMWMTLLVYDYIIPGDIDIPEHNKMSLSGDIFIDGSSKGTIDVCDVDLGGNENTYSTLEKEKLVYDDENVAVYFNSIDINQMNFCIENKMDNAITVGFWGDEDLEIDGSVYGSSVATINSHSSGIYIGYLYSSSNDNIQIMDFQSFDGIMKIKNQKNQDIESINLNFTSD